MVSGHMVISVGKFAQAGVPVVLLHEETKKGAPP
jgi:hypothetical protein